MVAKLGKFSVALSRQDPDCQKWPRTGRAILVHQLRGVDACARVSPLPWFCSIVMLLKGTYTADLSIRASCKKIS